MSRQAVYTYREGDNQRGGVGLSNLLARQEQRSELGDQDSNEAAMSYRDIISKAKAEIQQSPVELAAFCQWIEAQGIKSYLEIGLNTGACFTLLSDTFGFYPACGIELRKDRVKVLPVGAEVFYGNCRGKEALAWAKKRGPFDLIMIDGSHYYDNVKGDYEAYKSLGRFIALHDIALEKYDVPRLWSEITAKRVFEVIDPKLRYGIGIVEGED